MPRSRSKTPTDQRIRAERTGHRGEALAALFLQAKLYRIRDRRYKTPLGEIDLVVERGNTIVFVEVNGVGPSNRTQSGSISDHEAGVLILEMHGAEIAEG